MEEYLLDRLKKYTAGDVYPLHMPGHKRRICHFDQPFAIDITEIEGFDNLFHAEGILQDAQRRAARLYGADETYYLINGSTGGILAAIAASTERGGRIVMARNSHKSAYHAALLNGLHVTWLYPETDMARGIYGNIRPVEVRAALDGLQSKGETAEAVFITSPTYDGVVSDICAIAKEAHRAGALLIVDEAHGAHFAMHPYFPASALELGADIVVNSLHKTMPALTQTALLHVKGELADRERLKKYLGIYQSSSPSYVLMAGIDECIRMMEQQGDRLFTCFAGRLEELRGRLSRMRRLHLVTGDEPEVNAYDFDRSRILISTEKTSLTGPALGRILRDNYGLEPEMEAERYVTAIMTVADSQEGFDRLQNALLEIDAKLQQESEAESPDERQMRPAAETAGRCAQRTFPHPLAELTMEQADRLAHEPIPIAGSGGRIAAEFVYLYPPGIPFLVPGERIPPEFFSCLRHWQEMGLKIQGMADCAAQTILCVAKGEAC